MVPNAITWRGICGTGEELTSKTPFVDQLKKIFEDKTGLKFVKINGGKRCGNGRKVYGHHIMNYTLRKMTPTTDAAGSSH